MKTNVVARNVTVSASESAIFGISNNAKIFRILIDGLYANKIQSITREIWSNALDGHAAAGCTDRPFDVTFPSAFDPTFRVRDYGCSLSHDMVMHMYTDLGHSTKEDTNDAVGKFGIGSKSPFSYTDNFTVTAYLDGEVRFYSAMIGSDGVPAIHLMGVQPTDEENGIEVSFPVEVEDTSEFAAAAKRVSYGFDVKPNVIGDADFNQWPSLPVLMEGEGWKLLKGKIEGYSQQAYARMGPVLYPINVNSLGELTADQRDLLGYTFVIDFAMGDLEMTASREELSYGRNDPTTKAIIGRVQGIVESLAERCLESYSDCESYFEACVKFRDETTSIQLPEPVKAIIKRHAKWQGRALSSTLSAKWVEGLTYCLLNEKRLKNKTARFAHDNSLSIAAKKETLIAIEDVSEEEIKRAPARLKEYLLRNQGKYEQVLWVRVRRIPKNPAEMIEFFGKFDGADTAFIADMELPVRTNAERGVYARRPVPVRVLRNGNFDCTTTLTAEEFDEGGIYVPLHRMEPVIPSGAPSPGSMKILLHAVGALDERVYGAPKSLEKKFQGDQWVNLYDIAAEWVEDNDFDFAKAAARREAVRRVKYDPLLRFVINKIDLAQLDPSNILNAAADLRNVAVEDTTPTYADEESLFRGMGKEIPEHTEDDPLITELEQMHADILEAYPMMDLLASSNVSSYDTALDKLTEYVIMCDNVSETNHQTALVA